MIEFRLATESDFDDYFLLKCDPNNIYWSGHKNEPNYRSLKDWYIKNINITTRTFYLVYKNNEIVGYLYIDKLNQFKVLDTGYGVIQKMNGKGIGTRIIQFSVDWVIKNVTDFIEIQGWVAQENIGSAKVFLKNGFKVTGDRKKVKFISDGTVKEFVRYSLENPKTA